MKNPKYILFQCNPINWWAVYKTRIYKYTSAGYIVLFPKILQGSAQDKQSFKELQRWYMHPGGIYVWVCTEITKEQAEEIIFLESL